MPIMTIGTGRTLISGKVIRWRLRDEFPDTLAAGSVNGTLTVPGGTGGATLNTRTVSDSTSGLSLSGGRCQIVGSGVGWAQPGLWYGQILQAQGLLFSSDWIRTNATHFMIGWSGAVGGSLDIGVLIAAAPDVQVRLGWGGAFASVALWALNTEYKVATVWRASGMHYLIKGGAFADWRLMLPAVGGSGLTPYPGISCVDGDGWNDNMSIQQLAAPWDTAYGIATQRLAGARSAGDTFTHEADCSIEFTVATLPTAGQVELFFRIQDATNYWQVTVDSTGALDLDEVVAGTPTERGTSAGAISAGERIVINAHSQTIDVFDPGARHIHYTTAANFLTETDGELNDEGTGGAVTDIVSWPYALSGAALAQLTRYAG